MSHSKQVPSAQLYNLHETISSPYWLLWFNRIHEKYDSHKSWKCKTEFSWVFITKDVDILLLSTYYIIGFLINFIIFLDSE